MPQRPNFCAKWVWNFDIYDPTVLHSGKCGRLGSNTSEPGICVQYVKYFATNSNKFHCRGCNMYWLVSCTAKPQCLG